MGIEPTTYSLRVLQRGRPLAFLGVLPLHVLQRAADVASAGDAGGTRSGRQEMARRGVSEFFCSPLGKLDCLPGMP